MTKDKKEYQAVVTALMGHSTLSSLINKLTKIFVVTEDPNLKKGLDQIISHFKEAALIPKMKSQSGSVNINDPKYKPLVDYCQKCIKSFKPQWQIIAEQHGWGQKNGS